MTTKECEKCNGTGVVDMCQDLKTTANNLDGSNVNLYIAVGPKYCPMCESDNPNK